MTLVQDWTFDDDVPLSLAEGVTEIMTDNPVALLENIQNAAPETFGRTFFLLPGA